MSIRRALILDAETTGLRPPPDGTDACIEVGVIEYDLLHAAPIASFASLIRCDHNEAYSTNRIALGMLGKAPPAEDVWNVVGHFVERADVILAHRAEFDRGFVHAAIRAAKPWICTKFHVEWPEGKGGDHLVHIALAHGVGVVSAHRAMTDCDTLARLMTRVDEMLRSDGDTEPLVRLLTHAMRPRRNVQALVSYDDHEQAKVAGFAWEPATKRWLAELHEDRIATLPFTTKDVTP